MRKFKSTSLNMLFNDTKYADFFQLMDETARGVSQISKEDANDKIREIMFSVLDVSEDCSRKELRKAIRRHKMEVFEVIEETVQNLLISGWQDNEFFREFVEFKSMNLGDTNSFYTPDETILTVSEVSGNHWDLMRQRLSEGESFRVKTSWYAIDIYTEYELFMAGRVDWAGFINKLYAAFDKKVNDMLYAAVMAAGDKLVPNSQFCKTGALDSTTEEVLDGLIEDVQMATGDEVVIMGTRTALSKVTKLIGVDWASDKMKDERHTTGRIGYWKGIRLLEIPNRFADNDTSKKLVDSTKLLIMPVSDNKFIKMYDEGEADIKEISDGTTNQDMTHEYAYMQKMGIATIFGKKFGVWKNLA